MLLVVAVALAGIVAGRLRPPAGGHGTRPHLHQLPLLTVAAAAVAASVVVPDGLSTVTRGVGLAAITAFALRNRQVTGIAVAGLGALLNLLGLVLNNGIPVRPEALVDAGVVTAAEVRDHEPPEPHHLQTDDDRFAWLGAVAPFSPTEQVLSFGDLLVLVGGFDALRDLSRRRARPPAVPDEDDLVDARAETEPGADGDQPDATTQAKADQDWGTAPSAEAESGSQCSAKPDLTTAEAMEFWRDAAVAPSPAHLAARHDR